MSHDTNQIEAVTKRHSTLDLFWPHDNYFVCDLLDNLRFYFVVIIKFQFYLPSDCDETFSFSIIK